VEIETTPADEERIEWMLLTRYPVHQLEDAQTVLEGEEIVSEVVALVRGWGEQGAVMLLALIDDGAVEDHYSFLSELRRSAERHAAVLAAVRDGAARGGEASATLLAEFKESEFDRDLEGLARMLWEDIFPPAWPALSR
jgi:hypothetical protein